MAHARRIDREGILAAAAGLLEEEGPEALSLRAVAATLGVKAPSLYRYFADKAALERAVIEAGVAALRDWLRAAMRSAEPEEALREMAAAYRKFAKKRPELYFFTMHHRLEGADDSEAGRELWKMVLKCVGAVSGYPDDTAGAVAAWAFLHGFAVLEHSGRFGKSGPKGGFERGVEALLKRVT